jgi:hypothetical protein
MKLLRLLSCCFTVLLLASCSKESQTYIPVKGDCDSTAFSYHNDVYPIISTYCSGPTCHNPGTGNYDFSSYEVVADRIRNGKFDYRLLLPTDDPQHMPQTGPPNPKGYNLSDCDLYKILTWIKQGFPNN